MEQPLREKVGLVCLHPFSWGNLSGLVLPGRFFSSLSWTARRPLESLDTGEVQCPSFLNQANVMVALSGTSQTTWSLTKW